MQVKNLVSFIVFIKFSFKILANSTRGEAMRIFLFSAFLLALVGCSDRPPATCEKLVPEVLKISDANRMQSYGIAVVNVTAVSEITRNANGTSCFGTASLSNAEQVRIRFWTYKEGNRWMIQYQPL